MWRARSARRGLWGLIALGVAAVAAVVTVPVPGAKAAATVSVRKPDGGLIDAVFVVSLSIVQPDPVTVRYFTSDGTASGGVDYLPTSGRLVFRPGETRKLVRVPVVGNLIPEGDRSFFLNLESSNAAIADVQQMATIVDDHPFLEIKGTSVAEGPSRRHHASFVVSLSEPGTRPVSVDFATSDGSAVAGLDYEPTGGTLVFAPGEASKVILVPIIDDADPESNETFFVNLFNPRTGEIKEAQGLGTIVNDDATVSLGPPPPVGSTGPPPPGVSAGTPVRVAGLLGVTASGQTLAFGAPAAPPAAGLRLNQPMVGLATTPTGAGYFAAAADGGVFSFGDAGWYGSTGSMVLNQPIVGMAATPSGDGYWLVARDGGIFAFGGARFFGSTGGIRLKEPIVGVAATPTGSGYWLVASDGGVFAFGDAEYHGSTGALALNQPIVGMAATPSGDGYWLAAGDGGIFSFGGAGFAGSAATLSTKPAVVGIAASPSGDGYWLMSRAGDLFPFGDAPYLAPRDQRPPGGPVVAVTL